MRKFFLFTIIAAFAYTAGAQTAALREAAAFLKNFSGYEFRYLSGKEHAVCTEATLDNYFLRLTIENTRIHNTGTIVHHNTKTIAFDTRDISAVTTLDSLIENGQAVLWNVGFKTRSGAEITYLATQDLKTQPLPPVYQTYVNNGIISFGNRDVADRFRAIAKRIFK